MTSTAFCLSRLMRAQRVAQVRTPHFPSLPDDISWREIASTLQEDFILLYSDTESVWESTEADTHEGLGAKTAGNPLYSAALHLRGLAASLEIEDNSIAVGLGSKIALVLAQALRAQYFFVAGDRPDSETDRLSPLAQGNANWYTTYLVVDAVAAWLETKADSVGEAELTASLAAGHAGSLLGLTRMLALDVAGHGGDLDALELSACVASLLRCSRGARLQDAKSLALSRYALEVLATKFVHSDGTFAPKTPPLVDTQHTQMFVTSAEVAELLFDSASEVLTMELLSAYESTVNLICDRSLGYRGWGIDATGKGTRRSAFDACSSLAFLDEYAESWERLRSVAVGRVLRLEAPPKLSETWPLPAAISELVVRKTLTPIREGRRDLASMSLLLYGPPGTAKTTIAKRIAAELGWPLLSLDPSKLMSAGVDGIAVEADTLFALLPGLRDVVVLFDEFEGIFLKRASSATDMTRFLTTSMLPRLHELRDAGRIVFLIATNDRESIDPAAYRPGRIDEHIQVLPPAAVEAVNLLEARVNVVVPMQGEMEDWRVFWRSALADATFITSINGLTPAYLVQLVKSIGIDFNNEYTLDQAQATARSLHSRHAEELEASKGLGGTLR